MKSKAGKEVFSLSRIPQIYCCAHNGQAVVTVPSHINQGDIPMSSIIRVHFNIILPWTLHLSIIPKKYINFPPFPSIGIVHFSPIYQQWFFHSKYIL